MIPGVVNRENPRTIPSKEEKKKGNKKHGTNKRKKKKINRRSGEMIDSPASELFVEVLRGESGPVDFGVDGRQHVPQVAVLSTQQLELRLLDQRRLDGAPSLPRLFFLNLRHTEAIEGN
jgi:hypothetical protein